MRIAVVGATGLVGRRILDLLFARGFDPRDVVAYGRTARILRIGAHRVPIHVLPEGGRLGADVVVSSTPDDVARTHVPRWLDHGSIVVDESAAFRHDPRAQLVVVGVNDECLAHGRGLFAGPNCTTIQIALAVAGLHHAFGIEEMVVSTYQAASGAGREGLDALRTGDASVFGTELAGTVVPRIGSESDGGSSEELKLARELPVLLGAPVPVRATCVRVPVEIGHGASIWLRTERPIRDPVGVIDRSTGIRRVDGAPGPRDVAGTDDVLVARVRRHGDHDLSLWCVADNLRVGAATNAVRIVEHIIGASSPAVARGESV